MNNPDRTILPHYSKAETACQFRFYSNHGDLSHTSNLREAHR